MNNSETFDITSNIWKSKSGDFYYVPSTNDSLEYYKIYEVENDEIHRRDRGGKNIAIHF